MGFVDRPRYHGVDLPRHGEPGGFLQCRNSGAGGIGCGLARHGSLGAADESVMKTRVKLTGIERSADYLRTDSSGIAQCNANRPQNIHGGLIL